MGAPRIVPPLRLYLRLAFGICWGAGLLMLLTPADLGALKAAFWFLAVGGAPGIAALAAAHSRGRAAFHDYLSRLRRQAWIWCLAGPALIFGLHALAAGAFGAEFHWPGPSVLVSGLIAASLVDPGPLEEFGWRGFLQPLLQNRFGPLRASMLVGLIWGLWHLPVLIIPGFPQHDTSMPLALVIARFLLQTTALSVVMGFVLNRARGAVLPAMLMHWAGNQGAATSIWPFDATAWTATVTAAALLLAAGYLTGLLKLPSPVRQFPGAANPSP